MNLANKKLCQALFELTGWESQVKFGNTTPAYDLGYLIDKALKTGHVHVKIKLAEDSENVIITAPPCYRIEAKTPADGVAKLLIRSAAKAQRENESRLDAQEAREVDEAQQEIAG